MKLALLLAVGLALQAQSPTAVFMAFNSTVMRVTIGATQCTFWFHRSAPAPYDSETACYQSGKLMLVQAALPGVTTVESFDFPEGASAWQFKPNATDPSKIDYQISGQATGDAVPILKMGTL